MNILGFEIRKKAPQPPPVQGGKPWYDIVWYGGGITIIPANVMSFIREGFAGNSTVYHIVKVQSDKFSNIPFRLYKKKGNTTKYMDATKHYNPDAYLRKSVVMDELPEDDPLAVFLSHPNDFQTEAEFRKLWLIWMKIAGFAPIYANMGKSRTKVQAVTCLPPQWTTLTPDETLSKARNVFFSPFGAHMQTELPVEDVYLARYENPDWTPEGTHLYGQSPLKAALMDLKGSNEAKLAIAKMYENGGAYGLLTPKEPVNQTQASNYRETVDKYINGANNKGKVGQISVPMDFQSLGLDAVDMKLIEGGALTDQRLALAYNHPPALLQADNKYDNQLEAVKYLVTNSIYADLVAYRSFINTWLLPIKLGRPDIVSDFDITELAEMQGDMSKVSDTAIKLVKEGIINRNEGRAMMKYDDSDVPEMNMFFIPTGYMPIGESGMGGQDATLTTDYGTITADQQ